MSRARLPLRDNRPARPPLDRAGLEALALNYAGRYLTTRGRLAAYLARKLRERGGEDDAQDAVAAIVARMAELGYVDDRAFAAARAGGLSRRGYGARRVDLALRAAGVAAEDAAAICDVEDAEGAAWEALLRFARRRRIGPFGAPPDQDGRRRAFAAILRAGHPPALATRLLGMSAADGNALIEAE